MDRNDIVIVGRSCVSFAISLILEDDSMHSSSRTVSQCYEEPSIFHGEELVVKDSPVCLWSFQ